MVAYRVPNLQADLVEFDKAFHLPWQTIDEVNLHLDVLNQDGDEISASSPFPPLAPPYDKNHPNDSLWGSEIAMDVDGSMPSHHWRRSS